jgi:hypothetical protein
VSREITPRHRRIVRAIRLLLKIVLCVGSLCGFLISLHKPGARDGYLLAILFGIVLVSAIAGLALSLRDDDNE